MVIDSSLTRVSHDVVKVFYNIIENPSKIHPKSTQNHKNHLKSQNPLKVQKIFQNPWTYFDITKPIGILKSQNPQNSFKIPKIRQKIYAKS